MKRQKCFLVTILLWSLLMIHTVQGDTRWEFDDPDFKMAEAYGCELKVEEGLLKGITKPSNAVYFILPEVSEKSPLDLHIRLRTDEELYGRGEVYWITEEDEEWNQEKFFRFPIAHDGQWHDYKLAIPSRDTVKQIRVCPGWTEGTFEVDYIRLEKTEIPQSVEKAHKDLPRKATMEGAALKLDFDPEEHLYALTDKRTGRVWTSDGSRGKSVLTRLEVVNDLKWRLQFFDRFTGSPWFCVVELREGDSLAFTIESDHLDKPCYGFNNYPPVFRCEGEGGYLLFCDRSSGTYIPQTDEFYGTRALRIWGNTACTDTPWIGIEMAEGDGMMIEAETPTDGIFTLKKDDQKRSWPQIIWEQSMDSLRYARTTVFRFVPEGGYVAQAKRYRQVIEGQGRLITLEEKAKRKPNVPLLKGAPPFWGGTDCLEFVRQARPEGILRGIFSNAHHGLYKTENLRKLNDMGYITAPYDQPCDIQEGPRGHGTDNIEEAAYHARPGLGPASGWVDEVNAYYTRSNALALEAMETYFPGEVEKYGFSGAFIDVLMAISLHEDYHPNHTYDRRQDLEYRRGVFAWLDSLGLVLGTEHGNDWGLEFIEYTEGALGGPLYWEGGWNMTMLMEAENKEDYNPNYLKYGTGYDTSIPLWQLIYSDCVVSTYYWADCAGYHYRADPELADRKDLFTILYGGVPLFWRDRKGFDWFDERDRFLRSFHDTTPLHAELGFEEMVSHEFLSEDRALQRTRFTGGYEVVVNFSLEARDYTTVEGVALTLAPKGFYAKGPGIIQSRLLEDGQEVSVTEKRDYVRYITPKEREFSAVKTSGRFLAFKESADQWNLVLEPGRESFMEVANLTGWPVTEAVTLVALDEEGNWKEIRHTFHAASGLQIKPEKGERFFALARNVEPGKGNCWPRKEWLDRGERILLTDAAHLARIHYTWDGSEPTVQSSLYKSPLTPNPSGHLKFRVFNGRYPLGSVQTYRFHRVEQLASVRQLKGGDEPVQLSLDLTNAEMLRIFVGNGGDHGWNDWAVFANAQLVDKEGNRTWLSDLEPAFLYQTIREMGRDENPEEGQPLKINGTVYEKGITNCAEADLRYQLDKKYVRFEALLGIDDRANPAFGVHETLQGRVDVTIQKVLKVRDDSQRIALTATQVEEPIQPRKDLQPGDHQDLSELSFSMSAPWMDGSVKLRIPETLVSSMGFHFADNIIPPHVVSLNYLEEYPQWHLDRDSGALAYDVMTQEGLLFGCTATPHQDAVDLEFRVTNHTGQKIDFVSGNMCFNLNDSPDFDHDWNLEKLLLCYDGQLHYLSETLPTPGERNTKTPWLHFLSLHGLKTYMGERLRPDSWFTEQVAGPENLLAAESGDGEHLIGYTWDVAPEVLMSNCGHPCLHTGTAPSPSLGLGETHRWMGRIYMTANDREALVERVRREWDR